MLNDFSADYKIDTFQYYTFHMELRLSLCSSVEIDSV